MIKKGSVNRTAIYGQPVIEVALSDEHEVYSRVMTDGEPISCTWSRYQFVRTWPSSDKIETTVRQWDTLRGDFYLRMPTDEELSFAQAAIDADYYINGERNS